MFVADRPVPRVGAITGSAALAVGKSMGQDAEFPDRTVPGLAVEPQHGPVTLMENRCYDVWVASYFHHAAQGLTGKRVVAIAHHIWPGYRA